MNHVYNGFLFVGDPHIWHRKPGRRLDNNFTDVVTDKIKQASIICAKNNLKMICLGDLFHEDEITDTITLIKVIQAFQPLKNISEHEKPVILSGNHDKNSSILTNDTSLALLREANIVETIEHTKIHNIYKINDNGVIKNVVLGASPYGQIIPDNVTKIINEYKLLNSDDNNSDCVVWITHHDLAFDGAYPGSQPLKEIIGCDMLVNGHNHLTKKPIKTGKTINCNPGNITRLSVDCINHVPSVWSWKPSQLVNNNPLEQIVLKYQKDIFDLSDKIIQAAIPNIANIEVEVESLHSEFVELFSEDVNLDYHKTDDGAVLLEDIDYLIRKNNVNEEIKLIVLQLFKKSTSENYEE